MGAPIDAAARIDDTNPQRLGEVAIKPGFMDGTVTWNTSEPTDALIQFGESPFLGRIDGLRGRRGPKGADF